LPNGILRDLAFDGFVRGLAGQIQETLQTKKKKKKKKKLQN
jgi:hypothetical protein